MTRYNHLISLLFILLFSSSFAQKLSKIENKIVKDIKQEMPSTISFLKETVNINSGTFNTIGVKKVSSLYKDELEKLGFTVEWITMPDSLKRAGHLVAYRKGTKGKRLFLIGHLDTVFELDMPENPFRMINDSIATGQGVNDMKGGNTLIIASLKALHKNKLLDNTSITVYLTGDEENAGDPHEISRGDFIERAKKHDIALGFETASGMNIVATARRGSSGWKLVVNGEQAHSSAIFRKPGFGSIYEATRIINEFRLQLSNEPYLTFNPGVIMGGSEMSYKDELQGGQVYGKTDIIAPQTIVLGDLRFLTEDQKNKARDVMSAIVKNNLPGTSAKIYFNDGIPSMPPTVGNENLVKVVSNVSIALGLGEVNAGNPGARGAGDISYVANYLDCLDGLGVSGAGAHTNNETINMNEFPRLIERAALVIYRLTR